MKKSSVSKENSLERTKKNGIFIIGDLPVLVSIPSIIGPELDPGDPDG